jgi:hypothetical protein
VEDAAKALLEVGSYANYVKAQSETALRRMASVHPYDLVEDDEAVRQGERPTSGTEKPDHDHTPVSTVSLRDGGDAVIEALLHKIRTRMEPVGVSVLEARISHLAYSSEIAGAMLRKQAASAVVAARRMVVKGAVSIVGDALSELDKKQLADALDPERKAAMISKTGKSFAGSDRRAGGHYSITSSARTSKCCGTLRPSCLAALRLMTKWNFVDLLTGRSAGMAPLRIWPTKPAAMRIWSTTSTP